MRTLSRRTMFRAITAIALSAGCLLGLSATITQSQAEPRQAASRKPPKAVIRSFRAPISNDDGRGGSLDTAEMESGKGTHAIAKSMAVTLGRGLNSITDTQLNQGCVSSKFAPPDKIATTSPDIVMTLVKTADQFQKESALEASADTRFGMFSASASAKLRSTEEGSSQAIYLFVKSTVTTANIASSDQKIGPGAKKIYESNRTEFVRRCGDQFIDELVLGAEFVGIFSYEASDAKSLREVEAHLQAAVAASSVKADFKQSLTNASQKSSSNYRAFRAGGSGDMPSNDVDKILDYAFKFSGTLTELDHFVIVERIGKSYADIDFDVEGLPDVTVEWAKTLHSKIRDTSAVLDQIAERRIAYRGLEIPEVPGLVQQRNQIAGTLKALQDARAVCGRAPLVAANCASSLVNYQVPAPPAVPLKKPIDVRKGDWQFVGTISPDRPVAWLVAKGDVGWGNGQVWHASSEGCGGLSIRVGQREFPCNAVPLRLSATGQVFVRINDSKHEDNSGNLDIYLY